MTCHHAARAARTRSSCRHGHHVNGTPNYVPTGLTTIGTEATTILSPPALEKFKAPPQDRRDQLQRPSPRDKVAWRDRLLDTEGFTDSYAKYKVTVAGQTIMAFRPSQTQRRCRPFAIGSNQTASRDPSTTTWRTPSRASASHRPSSRSPSRLTSTPPPSILDRRGRCDRHREGHRLRARVRDASRCTLSPSRSARPPRMPAAASHAR